MQALRPTVTGRIVERPRSMTKRSNQTSKAAGEAMQQSRQDLLRIYEQMKTIAVVGASADVH